MRTGSTRHAEMALLASGCDFAKIRAGSQRRRFDGCAGFAAAGFLFGPLLGPGERIVTAEPARWVQIQPTPWEGASPAQAGSGSSFEEEECRQAEVADGGLG